MNIARKPVVAIIGRPNVGKSTLVNRIIGERRAIVDDQPGVTRDRNFYEVEWLGRPFYLMDTGGLIPEGEGQFDQLTNQQVFVGIDEADVVVFLVDGRSGITALDEKVAMALRKTNKPVILAVNKIDTPEQAALIHDFYSLGFGALIPVSAIYGFAGVGDLLDAVFERCPVDMTVDQAPEVPLEDNLSTEQGEDESEAEETNGVCRFAFLGRPNVGKSSLLNRLSGKERVMVSDIPGTTRDSVEIAMEQDGNQFLMVDTAGIRRKSKVDYGIEMFSVDRSFATLNNVQVAVLVLDAVEGLTHQDKRLVETIVDKGCGLVIVINKWDLMGAKELEGFQIAAKQGDATQAYQEKLFDELPHGRFAKVVFTSAKTGKRVPQILNAVQEAYQNGKRRVKTSLVNQVIQEAVTFSPPPIMKNRSLKVLYATQIQVHPPTFLVFVNDAKLVMPDYRRYLTRKLRENFDFSGTPVHLVARTRTDTPRLTKSSSKIAGPSRMTKFGKKPTA